MADQKPLTEHSEQDDQQLLTEHSEQDNQQPLTEHSEQREEAIAVQQNEEVTAKDDTSSNIPGTPSGSDRGSDSDQPPKTPAEKVRFILSHDSEEVSGVDVEEANEWDLDVHALFCQMDVLCHFEDGETGWKEAARWLKYEEKVEAGNRWSKPHVATVSLFALQQVKKALEEDIIILDLEAPHGCLHQVAERMVEVIAKEKGFDDQKQRELINTLLRPHKHKHRKGQKKGKDVQANTSNTSQTSSQLTSTPKKDDRAPIFNPKKISQHSVTSDTSNKSEISNTSARFSKLKDKVSGPIGALSKLKERKDKESADQSALNFKYPRGLVPDKLMPYKPNKRLMSKIPGGSEAANILVGQVDFLTEPVIVFCRLKKSAMLADLTEVAIPTRFIFLFLAPIDKESIWQYGEVGRAMAALFSDRVFCEVAYKATDAGDLVVGIDEYIDELTVLPPSIWDPTTRLDPPEKTMTIEKIRNRLLDSNKHAPKDEAFHFAESAGEDENLKRTGKLFGGLWNDMKSRYKYYWSDITDGLHLQCLASIVFLYFACITPIVTFGGLLGDATGNYMGIMETLLSGCVCGIIYALFAGQPLSIVGATGPLLIFESIVYRLCSDFEWDFLSFRFWIGAWITLFLLLIVAFDLSALVVYITRFTEESFAVLISLIFIAESFKKLAHIWDTHPIHIHAVDEPDNYDCHCEHPPPSNATFEVTVDNVTDASNASYHTADHPIFEMFNWTSLVSEDCITYSHKIVVQAGCISEKECLDHEWMLIGPACNVATVTHSVPDVFFFSCFLFIGTFVIAIFCRNFRTGLFFPSIVRSIISDFAVLLAIILCTILDTQLGLDTPKLHVPTEFKNTNDARTWVVNPGAFTHWWLILLALIPAALGVILIFLDQQITGVIVNRKEHKLQKGGGYHLDLFVLLILIFICSLLGLPWFVAATVRAITHVRSLIKESELRAPGERPQFLGVREQRVTGVVIHILIGVSVFLTPILKNIPMAVLYGVFLYMGVTSLSGVQFVQRIGLLFMPQKYQPDYVYLRHVVSGRVHVFTIIQVTCMVVMWVFKSIKSIAITFPLLLLVLILIRKMMDYYFTQAELFWLDHLMPDESRRKKAEEALEEGTALVEDEKKHKDLDDLYATHIMSPNQDQPGEWDSLIANRDYGLGLRPRPRKMSARVIQRWQDRSPNAGKYAGASIAEDEEDFIHPRIIPVPFRARKFSF